jgi:predicted transposase/invertase (TIGR01784 family)
MLPHFDDLRRAFPKPPYDGTMDFVCKLSNGEYAMVEMQVIPYDFWDRRALGYVAAFYGKQMREGEKWKDIKRVIGVNILGGGKGGLEHWKDSPTEYMRHYKMQEQFHSPARYIDGIEIIQYSLMHTPQSLEDREKKDWFTFFKEASHMTEEDVREKISTPAVLEAFERAKLSTLPDRVREMYAMEESQYAQYSIHTQEQIEKGKADERAGIFINLIKKMKSEGKSNKKIKKRLSLSDEEFEEYVSLIEV